MYTVCQKFGSSQKWTEKKFSSLAEALDYHTSIKKSRVSGESHLTGNGEKRIINHAPVHKLTHREYDEDLMGTFEETEKS